MAACKFMCPCQEVSYRYFLSPQACICITVYLFMPSLAHAAVCFALQDSNSHNIRKCLHPSGWLQYA